MLRKNIFHKAIINNLLGIFKTDLNKVMDNSKHLTQNDIMATLKIIYLILKEF